MALSVNLAGANSSEVGAFCSQVELSQVPFDVTTQPESQQAAASSIEIGPLLRQRAPVAAEPSGPTVTAANLVSIGPAGSLVSQAVLSSDVTTPNEVDEVTLDLDAGQVISIVMKSDSTLIPQMELRAPGNQLLADQRGSVEGETITLQGVPVPTDGTYRLQLAGRQNSQGTYEVQIVLNAVIEEESIPLPGAQNNSLAASQNIAASLIDLAGGRATQRAVVGSRGVDLEDNFESGSLNGEWATASSTGTGVVRVASEFGASDGQFSLVMGRGTPGISATRNEATWTVDLSGVTSAVLTFDHTDFEDEVNPLPATFTGNFNGDGVSISADGINWHRIVDAKNIVTGQWVTETVDLVTAANSAGISLTSTFQIRFQQFDDTVFVTDGRAYDKIRITTTPARILDDWYRVTLNDGQLATFVLSETGQAFGSRLELYSEGQELVASGQSARNLAQRIDSYRDDTIEGLASTYYLRVVQPATDYVLMVYTDTTFDTEPNQTLTLAQPLERDLQAVGHVDVEGSASMEVLSTFPGPDYTGFIPPDPTLAAGPKQVVGMVNATIEIYDKTTGAQLFSQKLSGPDGFFGSVGATTTVFDPWVIFDEASQRFFLVGIDIVGGNQSHMYVAVSTTATPTDGSMWSKHKVDFTHDPEPLGLGLDAHFPDYPKFSLDGDALYISSNYFPIGPGSGVYAGIVALDKAQLVSGGSAKIVYEDYFSGLSAFPLQMYGSSGPQYFAEAFDPTTMRIHAITDVLTNPQRHTTLVTVPAYQEPTRVPQLGGATGLDFVGGRIMGGVWRNGSAWFTHGVVDPALNNSENVARWYEVQTNNFPLGAPTLRQTGQVDPGPGVHAWMPALAVDRDNNMAIGFSIGGASMFGGAAYTGRLATDPLGQTNTVVTYAPGQGSYQLVDGSGRNRWGDYTGMVIDPTDDLTFWVLNEYASSTGAWATQVASFQIAPAPETDYYSFEVQAGDQFSIETFTPFDGPLLATNLLDPALELYGPDLGLITTDLNSATDGRNAKITHTAIQTGTYRVRVKAEAGEGTYLLSVTDTTGGEPTPDVIDTSPDAGQLVPKFPTEYRVEFSEAIAITSVDAFDILVNSVPATSVTVQGNTLIFQINPSVNVGDATYTVTMSAGAVSDLQGNPNNESLTATFTVDTAGPRILQTQWNGNPFPGDRILSPGPLTFQATLSEDIFLLASARRGPLSPSADDIILRNRDTTQIIEETTINYSQQTDIFTANYNSIPEGNYSLTLVSGVGAFRDDAGNNMDGEAIGPNPDGTVTGDGVAGGNYVLNFVVDSTLRELNPFQRLDPLGLMISRSEKNSGYINETTDIDEFSFFAHQGEKISGRLSLGGAASATLELIGSAGTSPLGTSTAAGASVSFNSFLIPSDGVYRFRITGDARSTYELNVVRNATVEAFRQEATTSNPLVINLSQADLGVVRWAVIGNTSKQLGFTRVNDPSKFVDIAGNGNSLFIPDDRETTIETTVGNETLPAGFVTVASNGGVLSGIGQNLFFVNLPLPAPDTARGLFPYWDDLDQGDDPIFWTEQTVDGVDTLIVQWQNRPHFPATGDVTFQVQVFESGPVLARFAYRDVVFGDPLLDNGASSTIGYQASVREGYEFNFGGADLPANFLPTNPVFDGDVIDLAVQPDVDDYQVDLTSVVGSSIDIVLSGLGGVDLSNASLVLLDPNGNVVATSVTNPLGPDSENFDLSILKYNVPSIGNNRFRIRVANNQVGEYAVAILDSAAIEVEPNQLTPNVRSLEGTQSALGFLSGAGDVDRFAWPLVAGQEAIVSLQTLLDDPQSVPLNDLDAELRILAADGTTLLASDLDSLDGKNPIVSFVAPQSETVTIEIISTSGLGEYRLDVEAFGTDFGDAPVSFSTGAVDGDGRHAATGPQLGAARDADTAAQPTSDATGDDTNGNPDDEDGLTSTVVTIGQSAVQWQVNVQNASAGATLDAWLDFNGDGQWTADERIASGLAVVNGDNLLTFDVPVTAVAGTQIVRLRLSSAGVSSPHGLASDGEIEDHAVTIAQLPEISVDSVSVVEGLSGITNLVFTITRSHNLTAAQVNVATQDQTAIGGQDYVVLATTPVSFAAGGALQQTVTVQVLGDSTFEADEDLRLLLSDPVGATLGNAIGTGTILNDDSALQIFSVRASSSLWTPAYLASIDPVLGLGYEIPKGSQQLTPLPWSNLDTVIIQFSADVGASLTPNSVTLNGLAVADYAPTAQEYNAAEHRLTLRFGTPFAADRLTLQASDSIVQGDGIALDGEWVDGTTLLASGDGAAGGNFIFRWNVLPGDVNGSGSVDGDDVSAVRASIQRAIGDPRYNPLRDVNGSGRILGTDLQLVIQANPSSLPPAPIPAVAVDSLFAFDEDVW